jgi:hypothetical protein
MRGALNGPVTSLGTALEPGSRSAVRAFRSTFGVRAGAKCRGQSRAASVPLLTRFQPTPRPVAHWALVGARLPRQYIGEMADRSNEGGRVLFAVVAPIAYALLLILGSAVLLAVSKQAKAIIQESGKYVFAELLTALVSFAFLSLYAARIARSSKAPSWPLVLPPILGAMVAAPGLTPRAALFRGCWTWDSVDPNQRCRVYSEGFSEALGLLIVGGVLSCMLCVTACTVAAARTPSRARQGSMGVHVPTLSLGLGSLLSVVTVHVLLSPAAARPPFMVVASFLGVMNVAIATPKTSEQTRLTRGGLQVL